MIYIFLNKSFQGDTEKFFVSGGFAVTHADSVQDVSVPEAFPLSEFDPAVVKSELAEAMKAGPGSVEATIKVGVYGALARALGVSV
jgi:F-type H+-transporting ATPase subunit delta